MSNDGLIIEYMDLSHIHVPCKKQKQRKFCERKTKKNQKKPRLVKYFFTLNVCKSSELFPLKIQGFVSEKANFREWY